MPDSSSARARALELAHRSWASPSLRKVSSRFWRAFGHRPICLHRVATMRAAGLQVRREEETRLVLRRMCGAHRIDRMQQARELIPEWDWQGRGRGAEGGTFVNLPVSAPEGSTGAFAGRRASPKELETGRSTTRASVDWRACPVVARSNQGDLRPAAMVVVARQPDRADRASRPAGAAERPPERSGGIPARTATP